MGKILCATRGGEASIRTQKAAIARAKKNKDELIFFYVVDVDFLAQADYALRPDVVTKEMDKMADFLLAMAVERAEKGGVGARYVMGHGNFVEQLKETIEAEGITLVILGRPGEDGSAFELEGLKRLAEALQAETGVEFLIA
jgi:nucleotide-binding universal stress UspA family protein